MATDQDLIDRCLAGERSAFDHIVRRYQDALYRHLLRLAGSPEQAEDLCQEAFVKFYRALPKFHRGRTVAPLLFKIATNLWRDGRHRAVASAPGPVAGNPVAPCVAEEAIRRVERDAVARAITGLRAEYREVLSLRYDQGLSYREIAQVTGASEGTVGTRLRRALDALRSVLAHDEEGEDSQ
ncbi:MAG: RNA polymerase sigma factor [Planctomycetota bacterium]